MGTEPRNVNEGQGGPGNTKTRFRLPSFIQWFVEDVLTNEFQFSATADSGYTSILEFELVSQPVSANFRSWQILGQVLASQSLPELLLQLYFHGNVILF